MTDKQIEEMVSTLKIIHTWASYDLEKRDFRLALNPAHTIKLIDKALGMSK